MIHFQIIIHLILCFILVGFHNFYSPALRSIGIVREALLLAIEVCLRISSTNLCLILVFVVHVTLLFNAMN